MRPRLFHVQTALLMTVFVAAGCGGSRIDKAGGSASQPHVLTLAAHSDDEEAYAPYVAAVKRLSGGTIRINVLQNWRATNDRREIDFERGIVADVRAGKADLGIVGARVWDTLGVTSFQALVAPFLIDSLELERRAFEGPYAGRALGGIRRAGVVGVALLPGRLRRPLGLTRSLLGLRDYRGALIAIRLSRVEEETFSALGARASGYIPGRLTGFDGTDQDLFTTSVEGFDEHARELTANVVLWPKPWTIVMNRAAFARLTPEQQQIFLTAGRDAIAPEFTQIARDQQLGLEGICGDKTMPLATATAADRAALSSAVQPVYRTLERDASTKVWIAQIRRMKAATSIPTDSVRCL